GLAIGGLRHRSVEIGLALGIARNAWRQAPVPLGHQRARSRKATLSALPSFPPRRSSDLGFPSAVFGTGPLRSGSPLVLRGTPGGRRTSHWATSDVDATITARRTATGNKSVTSDSDDHTHN